MQVFIKRLSGELETVEIAKNETAGMLMTRTGCNKFMCGTHILAANEMIVSSTLYEVAGLEGGKNKKSKKKDTSKPKHKKHVNKKVKLACLTHYKVEGGKVERLRKTCPNKKCGACCFLAQHKERLTCGHCHTSIPRAN